MADIAKAIVSKLTTTDEVTADVGTRVYPGYDRQSEHVYPLIVYELDVSPITAFDGPTGVSTGTLTLAAIAEDYADAVALGLVLRLAMEGATGTWAGVEVQGCFMQEDGEQDDVITDPTTEEVLYYAKRIRFDLTFND